MPWTPQHWALVWASRLAIFADAHNEGCPQMLGHSLDSSVEALRAALPTDLFEAVRNAANITNRAELRALAERLWVWSQGRPPSGEPQISTADLA